MSDLTDRLRCFDRQTCTEAADRIEALEAEIAAMRAGGEPVAVPLTDAQIDQAIAELGLNYLADAHATNRAVLQKLCRHAHSIKGGQHDV